MSHLYKSLRFVKIRINYWKSIVDENSDLNTLIHNRQNTLKKKCGETSTRTQDFIDKYRGLK